MTLVERCHRVVEDPGRLAALPGEIGRSFDDAFVSLAEGPAIPKGRWTVHNSPLSPDFQGIWDKQFGPEVRRPEFKAQRHGRLVELVDLTTEDQIRRTPFYSNFMEPQGLLPLAGMASLHPPTEAEPGFGLLLLGRRDFRADEVELCRRLEPQLRLAIKLAALRRADLELLEATRYLADRSRAGMLTLGEGGRLLWANRAARLAFEERDGLYVHDSQVVATRVEDTQKIREAVSALTEPTAPPWMVGIERGGKRRPLALFLVSAGSNGAGRQTVANGFLIDPDRAFRPSKVVLERLFQLTDAESRLALAVAEGESTAAIAARTDRSVETVRTQLKFVYRKVGVSRQIELVRVLMNLGLPSRRDEG